MKQLNIAVLGQGRSGRDIHGRFLKTDGSKEKYRAAYIVDPIPQRRERAAKEYPGCTVLADYKELFGKNDVDFVVNATPSHFHVPITLDLLNHGFNVLCEKPFARTAADVDAMIAAADKSGKMLTVFQQSRFAPFFSKIKEVIASGVLGRLIQISIQFSEYARRWDWQCCQEFVGGNLYNKGPHPVDQALDLLNYRDGMPGVMCKMDLVNTFGDAEDYVKLILTAPDRPLIDVEISSCDSYQAFNYRIMGSTGSLRCVNPSEVEWRWFDPKEAPEQHLIKEPLHDADWLPLYCREPLKWNTDSWSAPEIDGTYRTGVLYDTIYEHLLNGKPLVVTPQQVRQQMMVAEECHRQNPFPRKD